MTDPVDDHDDERCDAVVRQTARAVKAELRDIKRLNDLGIDSLDEEEGEEVLTIEALFGKIDHDEFAAEDED